MSSSIEGYGFFDLKSSAPNQVKRYLDNNGNKQIVKIEVKRSPIASIIQKGLNLISFGKFNQAKQNQGGVFHLYMVVFFADTRTSPVRIDKNEIVQINNGDLSGKEMMTVNIPSDRIITLNSMFSNAEKVERYHLWDYSASEFNCQRFIDKMLECSGLLSPELHKFIMQDANELIKSLPKGTNKIFNGITNTASWLRTKILGQGINKGRPKKIVTGSGNTQSRKIGIETRYDTNVTNRHIVSLERQLTTLEQHLQSSMYDPDSTQIDIQRLIRQIEKTKLLIHNEKIAEMLRRNLPNEDRRYITVPSDMADVIGNYLS